MKALVIGVAIVRERAQKQRAGSQINYRGSNDTNLRPDVVIGPVTVAEIAVGSHR